jgi:hypothetical protein
VARTSVVHSGVELDDYRPPDDRLEEVARVALRERHGEPVNSRDPVNKLRRKRHHDCRIPLQEQNDIATWPPSTSTVTFFP